MNNQKSSPLDRFKVESPKKKCYICDKEIEQYFAVSIRSTDPIHTYKNTNKPYVTVYKFILCEKHYMLFKNMLEEFSMSVGAAGPEPDTLKVKENINIEKEIDDLIEKGFID